MLYVFWGANIGLLAGLLLRAARNGNLFKYSVFYSYIAYVFLITIGHLVTERLYGIASPQYRDLYNYGNLLFPVFQLTILANIYKAVARNSFIKRLAIGTVIIGLLAGPILWRLIQAEGASFYRFQAALLLIQLAACIVLFEALINNADLDIGRNIRGVICGIALLTIIQSYNFLSLFGAKIRYDLFQTLVPVFYSLTLLVFNYALWDYHPMREIPERFVQIRLSRKLQGAVRSAITLMFK